MRRIIGSLVALGIAGLVGYLAFAFFWGVPRAPQHATLTDPKDIAAGAYLAVAGDCVSCHTSEAADAPDFAGGRAFDTPFGTIHSSNITPDAATGIGNMTSAEFYQTLVYGADSVLAPLYPAMPYTSFHILTREETDRLHAYFMSLEPVNRPAIPNNLSFPYDIRALMFGWNLMFASRDAFEPAKDKSDTWNRGAWLVEGLGHCGECHTPRNALGAMKTGDDTLSGAVLGGWEAPDIRPSALAERGWSEGSLVRYFETGSADEGTAFSDMFLAVKNSLRKMTPDDRTAIATYLMDGHTPAVSKTAAAPAAKVKAAETDGEKLYLANCALCHGAAGKGVPNTMPPLDGNATVAQADGRNLVMAIANGIEPESYGPLAAYGPMPGFKDRLTHAQIAALASYVRTAFVESEAPLPALSPTEVQGMMQ